MKKLLNIFLTLIIIAGVMSTATLAVMATESEPDTSSVVSEVSSEPVSSVESDTESDASSIESESEISSTESDESEVGDSSDNGSGSDNSNTSGVIDTSSEEEVSIPSGTNDATTSFSGNDAQTGNKYSTFIDESTGGTLTGGGDDYVDDDTIDDDDHFIDQNVTMFRNSIGRIIWIPILFTILAVGALIYINVIYPKNMGFVKPEAKSKRTGTRNKKRSTRRK